MFRLKYYIALFAVVLSFLVCTKPANHSEAEDTYTYAHMVEQGEWAEMFHQHHLLYLPIARVVYRGVGLFGYSGRALPVLIGMSMVSAALVICLFASLLRQEGRSRWWILPLLFSYGFWRYATAAEIYLPALAAVSAMWFFARRLNGEVWAACFAVLALLLHLVCLPAVFAVFVFYLIKRQWTAAGIVALFVGGVVAGAYGVIHRTVGMVVFQDAQVVRSILGHASTWVKGVVAFGQNLISGNFIFSIPMVAGRFVEWFPAQMLQEELFMGRQAVGFWRAASIVSFFSAVALLGLMVLRSRPRFSHLNWAAWVWLIGNMSMALLFEPANPEMWIFTLLPFWFLLANEKSRLLFVLVGAMALHNWMGGMAFVQKPEGDYCRQKAQWIIENVGEKDVVVHADSHSFSTFLQYYTLAEIIDAKFQAVDVCSVDRHPVVHGVETGRVFVYGEVFDPLPAVLNRKPESVAQLRATGGSLHPCCRFVCQQQEWSIYECGR